MASNQAQVSSDPVTSASFRPGLRYSTGCDVEPEPNKQSTISSNPVQESLDPINSRPASPGLRYSTSCDVELDSFCAIPIHILSAIQKYFLTTVPSPRKIISINLVSETSPVPSSPSDLSSLLEELAIPDHVLQPLQEYFLNRRTNSEQFPKYIGVRITQEDARFYENVLGCCERGCLDEVILAKEVDGASEEVGQDAYESRAEGLDEIIEHGSGNEKSGAVSINPDLESHTPPHGSSANDAEEEESSAEDASESGICIMATGESG